MLSVYSSKYYIIVAGEFVLFYLNNLIPWDQKNTFDVLNSAFNKSTGLMNLTSLSKVNIDRISNNKL